MFYPARCLLLMLISSVIAVNAADSECFASQKTPQKVIGINQDLLWTKDLEIDALIKIIKEAGITHIRIPVRWVTVEPEKGKWDFKKADTVIRKLRNADIEILGALMSFPAWENNTAGRQVEGWYDTYPPNDTVNWSEYVRKAVSRYKKEIKNWEIWNEENGVDFWRPLPDAKLYTAFLKSAYKVCKSSNPKCIVSLGGLQMNGIIANPWSPVKTTNFLQAIYDAGGKPYFDVVNIHPYVLPNENEGADYMKKLTLDTIRVMRKNGDATKPLWITEIGCGINEADTAEKQAELLKESFDALYSIPQVKAVYWFCLKDYDSQITGPEDSMGIVDINNAKKPSFYALQQTARKYNKLNK